MNIQFSKFSASGNDFIIIDNRRKILPEKKLAEFVRQVCAKRISVGADGVILIEKPKSKNADFRMRYFNADGSEAAFCGNGACSAVRFVFLNKIIRKKKIQFETFAGIHQAEILSASPRVRLKIAEEIKKPILNTKIKVGNKNFTVHSVEVGVPQAVIYTNDLEKLDVVNLGKLIRFHQIFQPQGTNVNFVSILDTHSLKIRTYERGVEDETLACGSGATASAIISCFLGKVTPPVNVRTRGNTILVVDFDFNHEHVSNVTLEAESRCIFRGYLTEEAFSLEK